MNVAPRWKHAAAAAALAAAFSTAAAVPAGAQTTTLKFISYQKDEKGVGDWFLAQGIRIDASRREDRVQQGRARRL
jgi:hypothetical protein